MWQEKVLFPSQIPMRPSPWKHLTPSLKLALVVNEAPLSMRVQKTHKPYSSQYLNRLWKHSKGAKLWARLRCLSKHPGPTSYEPQCPLSATKEANSSIHPPSCVPVLLCPLTALQCTQQKGPLCSPQHLHPSDDTEPDTETVNNRTNITQMTRACFDNMTAHSPNSC